MKAIVTSQHPNYPAVYTTFYKGQRFDINIVSGVVWHMQKQLNHFQNFIVIAAKTIEAITSAVNDYIALRVK